MSSLRSKGPKPGYETFVALDANAIIHRAYHAFPDTLTTSSGQPTNAVFGFTSMLLKVIEQFNPKYLLTAFDTKKPTFRHTKFADYKAHRKPTDQALIDQFALVEEIVQSLNIPILKMEGYEADDILGTISKQISSGKWSDYNVELVIVSGDRDLLQLINDRTSVCLPAGSFKNLIVYDRDLTHEKFGYYPEQVTDYKALVGDASDNIPGIKGIGDKSALELLSKYDSLDQIYKNINSISKQRLKMLIAEGVEQAYVSKDLATIYQDLELPVDLLSCVMRDFDNNKVRETFIKFQFRSLLDKIPKSVVDEKKGDVSASQISMFSGGEQLSVDFEVTPLKLESESDLQKVADLLGDCKELVYLYSREGEYSSDAGVCYYFVDNSGKIYSLWSKFDQLGTRLAQLCFTSPSGQSCETYGIGSQELLFHADLNLEKAPYDMALAAHYLDAGSKGYSLGDLIFNYVEVEPPRQDLFSGSPTIYSLVTKCKQAVDEKMSSWIEDGTNGHFHEVLPKKKLSVGEIDISDPIDLDFQLVPVLKKMESKGILLDPGKIDQLKKEAEGQLESLTEQIYHDVGHQFNINSPKQLGEILFDELKLGNSRSRKRSTREEVLLKMKDQHPVIEKILKYRETSKVCSTYILVYEEIARKHREGDMGVVNTNFEMLGTSSGRISSLDPNLQNIPARGEWADKIKSVFVARDGKKFVSLDYSQIEFRIIAHLSKDRNLIDDFVNDIDIHTNSASRVFRKDIKDVTPQLRSAAKTINFGILYGQSRYGLSSMLNISADQAQEYIDLYFGTYKGVAQYIKDAKERAKKNGYVHTLFGRRRYISGLGSSVYPVREAAIREAVNMPVQGSAADLLRWVMLLVSKLIEQKYEGKVDMLLQVHDELVFEVDQDLVERFTSDCKELMEDALKLLVPLKVGSGHGDNLSQLK